MQFFSLVLRLNRFVFVCTSTVDKYENSAYIRLASKYLKYQRLNTLYKVE